MRFLDYVPFAGFLLFAILLSGKIYFLRKENVSVSSSSRKNKLSGFLFPVFGLLFFMWIVEIAKPAFHTSFSILPAMLTNPLIESIWLKASGVILILLSLILWTITLLHFKTSLRFGLDENNQERLITTGIFSSSRNPFFLSLELYFNGVALIFTSPFLIGFAVLAVTGIHFYILKEEKFLRKVYGDKYEQYIKKVRRYF